jgi:ribosome-associated protein
VFSTEKRAFYGLERLRKSATSLTIDELNSEITRAIAAGRKAKPVVAKKAAKKVAARKVVVPKKVAAKTKAVAKMPAKAKKKVAPTKAKVVKKTKKKA